jgi:hypothetical protein
MLALLRHGVVLLKSGELRCLEVLVGPRRASAMSRAVAFTRRHQHWSRTQCHDCDVCFKLLLDFISLCLRSPSMYRADPFILFD